MTLYIHTIIHNAQALFTQAGSLFITGRAAFWQADSPAGSEHPVPGQTGAFRQLAEGTSYPACGSAQARQLGELAVRYDMTGWHQHQG